MRHILTEGKKKQLHSLDPLVYLPISWEQKKSVGMPSSLARSLTHSVHVRPCGEDEVRADIRTAEEVVNGASHAEAQNIRECGSHLTECVLLVPVCSLFLCSILIAYECE